MALDVRRVNLREERPPAAPTVSANLTAPLLLPLAGRMAAGEIDRPTTMVVSGLLTTEAERVRAAFEKAGLRAQRTVPIGEWTALLLRA